MDIIEIKKFMKENKITYEKLSKKSNISIDTIKQIFCGKTKYPRLDTMNAILDALNLKNESIDEKSIDPRLLNGLAKKGINIKDINKLDANQLDLIINMIHQMFKNQNK